MTRVRGIGTAFPEQTIEQGRAFEVVSGLLPLADGDDRRMRAISSAEVWRYNDRGRWIIVIVAAAFLLFGWVRLALSA